MALHDNLLLVEGREDLRIVPHVIERAGIPWGPKGAEVVRVHPVEGYENLASQFRAQLKGAGLRRVGVLVDANSNPAARWQSLVDTMRVECELPESPPVGGFVVPRTLSGKRLGVWMLPDNTTRGMMETFLLALRPSVNPPLHEHVEQATDAARHHHGARYREVHRDKALIHTWLAWQDPPGMQLHDAVKAALLDSTLPYAEPFVAWFKALYEIG